MQQVDGGTVVQIQQKAGIPLADVLKVVYGLEVAPATHKRIMDTASNLDTDLPVLQSHFERTLLIITESNMAGDYNGKLLGSLQTAADKYNFDLFVHSRLPRKHIDGYFDTLFETGCQGDGTFFTTQDNMDIMLPVAMKHNFRYVIGDCDIHDDYSAKHPVIGINNQQAMKMATTYLIEQGHKRIGFITGIPSVTSAQSRLAGYKEALEEAGLPVDDSLIIEGNWMFESGHKQTPKLLALDDVPTAIIASSDTMAIGAMVAIRESGRDIPRDIALLGFDNIEMASTVTPTLTTLRQPFEKLGEAAVSMIHGMLEKNSRYLPPRFFEAELVIRDSTAI